MTNSKLFDKLRGLIEDQGNTDKKHIKKIRKVLRKLKERQRELKEQLDAAQNPQELRKIEQEIEVIKLQRSKGAAVYKQLKKDRKKRKEGETRGPLQVDPGDASGVAN